MLSYDRLSKRPEIFRSFRGLEVSEFDSLYGKIEAGYDEYERKRLARKDRKRDVGAGTRAGETRRVLNPRPSGRA